MQERLVIGSPAPCEQHQGNRFVGELTYAGQISDIMMKPVPPLRQVAETPKR